MPPRPTHPLHWLAVGLGSGLAAKAPGTFGTLAALPLVIAGLLWATPTAYFAVGLFAFALGIQICARTVEDWRTQDSGVADPGSIVFDEWVGLWFTFIGLPLDWRLLLGGFLLFRLFDILKPWPVSVADRKVQGGLGIMLDDLIAGVMACAVLHLLWRALA